MKLTRIAVDNPVFTTMMMVALLVMGLFSYRQLGIDQFPNVDFPVVVVTTNYPGATPETVESEISRKIEESVNAIAGLKTLSSRSLRRPVDRHRRVRAFDPLGRRHAGRAREGAVGALRLPAGGQGAADPAPQPRRPADRVDRRAVGRSRRARAHDHRRPDHHQAHPDGARRRTRHDRRRREAPDQHRARPRPHAGAAGRRQRRAGGDAGREPELPGRQRPARQRRPHRRGHRPGGRARTFRRPDRRPARRRAGLPAPGRQRGRRRSRSGKTSRCWRAFAPSPSTWSRPRAPTPSTSRRACAPPSRSFRNRSRSTSGSTSCATARAASRTRSATSSRR